MSKICCAIGCNNEIPDTELQRNKYGGFCRACHYRIVQSSEKKTKEKPKPDLYDKYGWSRVPIELRLPYKMRHGFDGYGRDIVFSKKYYEN